MRKKNDRDDKKNICDKKKRSRGKKKENVRGDEKLRRRENVR